MNLFYLLWWWVIPTIISTATVQVKKQAILTRFSPPPQLQIQPKYQPQAAATSPAKRNTDKLELRSPSKQSEKQEVSSGEGVSPIDNAESSQGKQTAVPEAVDNVKVSPGKQNELQEASLGKETIHMDVESNLGKRNGPQEAPSGQSDNVESSSGKQNEELESPSSQAISLTDNVAVSPDKHDELQVAPSGQGISKREKLETSSEKKIELQEVPSRQEVIHMDNLESNIGKRSELKEAPSGQDVSPNDNVDLGKQSEPEPKEAKRINRNYGAEVSAGKQVAAGGSALAPNIGENTAPADERPSIHKISEGAPAPVAQPPPSAPSLQSHRENKNKTVNGTGNGTNTTTVLQDIDADMKKGAQGNSFADLNHPDLKNVQTRLEDLGGVSQGVTTCHGNRGVLRPMYERSKYFVDMVNTYTYEEGWKLCNKHELIFAEIDSLSDFKSIQLFYDHQYTAGSFNASRDRYFVGLNDLEDEGVYKRADGSNITFQAYFTSQPDDKDGNEDCTAVGKEEYVQPLGMMDVNCKTKYHVLCMFPPDDTCINDTREANLYHTWMKHYGVHALMDMTERAYSVSNFQLTWEKAFDYCLNLSMKIFDMDHIVTTFFFRTLYQYENSMLADTIPVIQYWTAGRFKQSHMTAEVYWETEDSVHSENVDEHRRPKQNFTFSGVFKWNNYKGADPTAKTGTRKDLCLTFGFQQKPEETPFVRNTNCGIPCYFVCSKDHSPIFEKPEIEDK